MAGLTFEVYNLDLYQNALKSITKLTAQLDQQLDKAAIALSQFEDAANKTASSLNTLLLALTITNEVIKNTSAAVAQMSTQMSSSRTSLDAFNKTLRDVSKEVVSSYAKMDGVTTMSSGTPLEQTLTKKENIFERFRNRLSLAATRINDLYRKITRGEKLDVEGKDDDLVAAKEAQIKNLSEIELAVIKAEKVTTSAYRNIALGFRDMGNSMIAEGKALLRSGALQAFFTGIIAKNVFQQLGQDAIRFEELMMNAASILDITEAEIASLSTQVRELGENSRYGPIQVADAFYEIASGVLEASARLPILQAAIRAAEAGNTDLRETTLGLIAAVNSYGSETLSAARAADIYLRTVAVGVGSQLDFVSAISPQIRLMSSFKVSFEEVGAAMAFLTAKGSPASRAMTQLASSVTALVKPNKTMEALITRLGYASGQAMLEAHGLARSLEMIQELAGNDMPRALGRKEGLLAVVALLTGEFKEFSKEFIASIDGSVDRAREVQLKATKAVIDQAVAAFQGMKIVLIDTIMPTINSLFTVFKELSLAFTEFIENHPRLVSIIANISISFLAMFAAVWTLLGVFKILTGIYLVSVGFLFKNISSIMMMGLIPATAYLTTIMGGLTGAIALFVSYGQGVAGLREAVDNLLGSFEKLFASLSNATEPIFAFINGVIQRVLSLDETVLGSSIVTVFNLFASAVERAAAALDRVGQIMQSINFLMGFAPAPALVGGEGSYDDVYGTVTGTAQSERTEKRKKIQRELDELNAGTQPGEYTIKKGDTLYDLARKYKTTPAELATLNNITNPRLIQPGQKIMIPGVGGSAEDTAKRRAELETQLQEAQAEEGTGAQGVAAALAVLNPNQRNLYQRKKSLEEKIKLLQEQAKISEDPYKVKKGDTLSKIAAQFGMTVEELARMNNIEKPGFILEGQRLLVKSQRDNQKTTAELKWLTYELQNIDLLIGRENTKGLTSIGEKLRWFAGTKLFSDLFGPALIDRFGLYGDVTEDKLNRLREWVANLETALVQGETGVNNFVDGFRALIGGDITGGIEKIKEAILAIASGGINLWNAIFSFMGDGETPESITPETLKTKIKEKITEIADAFTKAFNETFEDSGALGQAFAGIRDDFTAAFTNVVVNFPTTLAEIETAIKTFITNLSTADLTGLDELGALLINLAAGVAKIITGVTAVGLQVVKDIFVTVLPVIGTVIADVVSALSAIGKGELYDFLINKFPNLTGPLDKLAAGVKGFIENIRKADLSGIDELASNIIKIAGAIGFILFTIGRNVIYVGLETFSAIGEKVLPVLGEGIATFITFLSDLGTGEFVENFNNFFYNDLIPAVQNGMNQLYFEIQYYISLITAQWEEMLITLGLSDDDRTKTFGIWQLGDNLRKQLSDGNGFEFTLDQFVGLKSWDKDAIDAFIKGLGSPQAIHAAIIEATAGMLTDSEDKLDILVPLAAVMGIRFTDDDFANMSEEDKKRFAESVQRLLNDPDTSFYIKSAIAAATSNEQFKIPLSGVTIDMTTLNLTLGGTIITSTKELLIAALNQQLADSTIDTTVIINEKFGQPISFYLSPAMIKIEDLTEEDQAIVAKYLSELLTKAVNDNNLSGELGAEQIRDLALSLKLKIKYKFYDEAGKEREGDITDVVAQDFWSLYTNSTDPLEFIVEMPVVYNMKGSIDSFTAYNTTYDNLTDEEINILMASVNKAITDRIRENLGLDSIQLPNTINLQSLTVPIDFESLQITFPSSRSLEDDFLDKPTYIPGARQAASDISVSLSSATEALFEESINDFLDKPIHIPITPDKIISVIIKPSNYEMFDVSFNDEDKANLKLDLAYRLGRALKTLYETGSEAELKLALKVISRITDDEIYVQIYGQTIKLKDRSEYLLNTIADFIKLNFALGVDVEFPVRFLLDGAIPTQDDLNRLKSYGITWAGAIVEGVNSKLGIQSPSTWAQEVGGYITDGLAIGLETTNPRLTTAVETIKKYLDEIALSADGVGTSFNSMFATTMLVAQKFADSSDTFIQNIQPIKSAIDALKDAAKAAAEAITAMITAFGTLVPGDGQPGNRPVPTRALGGAVTAGTMYRVSERFPELLHTNGQTYLVPGRNGYIRPVYAQKPSAPSGSYSTTTYHNAYSPNVTVNVMGNGDPQAIASAVRVELEKAERSNPVSRRLLGAGKV